MVVLVVCVRRWRVSDSSLTPLPPPPPPLPPYPPPFPPPPFPLPSSPCAGETREGPARTANEPLPLGHRLQHEVARDSDLDMDELPSPHMARRS